MKRFLVTLGTGLLLSCGSREPQVSGNNPPAAAPRVAAAETSFDLVNNLIFVHGQLNQSKPLTFIFDTGASGTVISERLLKELGLKPEGSTDAHTGGGSLVAASIKDVDINVGGAQVNDITVAAIPFGGLESGFGMHIDGILGYELFERYVVDVDFDTHVLRFHPAASHQAEAGGEAVPIAIEENVPYVRVSVTNSQGNAVEGDFELDTGQTGTLTIASAFATANHLIGPGQKSLEMTTGALLPGAVHARVVRVPSVQLGPHKAEQVVALVTEQTGIAASKAGILGNEFLRRFNLTIDYKGQRLTLRPNAQAKQPSEFDMSGMAVMAEGDALRDYAVRAVISGTPAAAAGIRAGDTLVSLDGKAANTLSLPDIREALRRPDVEYSLVVRRGTQDIRTKLRTRRLI